MKETLIALAKMTQILFPDYEEELALFQKECSYFSHQISDCSLSYGISIIVNSPLMYDAYPKEHLNQIEKLLLSQLQSETLH
jgi:hypothetical protein